ncbi:MAG: DUF882 domain-containing protein [Pseudomonadota bacterium]
MSRHGLTGGTTSLLNVFRQRQNCSADGSLNARRRGLFAAVLAGFLIAAMSAPAAAETRTLKLYFTHTKERAEITYKRNGRYLQSGLNKLNRFLRDHRRNEPTKMDPKLFDLIWEAYRKTGSREYIHVVSAYRSPQTNAMLRRTRGGQATKSQHMLGKAIDFYIPGVSAKKLREIGFKLQGGGVGYYPRSGTPYVHFDTASVRAWPRMSRGELTRLFPNGRTLHLPPDGNPLPGYQQALADYKRRQARGEAVATVNDSERNENRGVLARVFGGNSSRNSERNENRATAQTPTPPTTVASLPRSQLPIPQLAPRASTGAPVAIAAAPAPAAPVAAPAEPAPTAPQNVVPQIVPTAPSAIDDQPQSVFAYAAPIPQRRPNVLVAAAPLPTERRSAAEIEAALNRIPVPGTPVPTNQTGGDDDADTRAILDAIAGAEPQSDIDATKLAYATLPSPGFRPDLNAPAPALPQTAAALPQTILPAPDGRGARFATPGERPISIDPSDAQAIRAAAFDSGVPTTPKTAKPTPLDAIAVASVADDTAVLSASVDPARFGGWQTDGPTSTADNTVTQRPDFAQNAIRKAPEMVYTQGFSKVPPPDASKFEGTALTFLAFARFDGAPNQGGDGQPLRLQVPATN